MPLATYPPYRLSNLPRTFKSHVPLKALRDLGNRLRLGPEAPLSDEPLFVDPREITLAYVPNPARGAPRFRRRHSGLVRGGDWDLSTGPLGRTPKEEAMRRRFEGGESWEETGVIDSLMRDVERKGSADGLGSRAALMERYAGIDALYEEARATGRLRLREELPDRFRREHGGILAHVDRHGRVLRAGGGLHRLGIAKILGLPEVPVQLGVIHPDAIRDGHLARLRRSRFEASEAPGGEDGTGALPPPPPLRGDAPGGIFAKMMGGGAALPPPGGLR